MKKTLIPTALAFTLIAVATLSAGSAFAQGNTASASANASTRVVAAIALTKTADLNFGDVVASASLVFRPRDSRNEFAVIADDAVRRFGPDEGSRILVPVGQEGLDVAT